MALLRVQQQPQASGPRFPRNLTTLGFCWLHGRVGAVAIQRGELIGTWHREDAPDDLARLGELVREAARATEYRGSTVSLMLAHPRLAHQLIETAPAKGAALEGMVKRQVERAKTFDGAAAWSFETTAGSKNPQSHLLHLLPQALLDQMVRSVEKAGLHLVSVLPPTAVLHGELTRLPIPPEEVAVIAADLGDRVTVVVGRKNGEILLARSLDATRSKGAASFAVDLSRTVLFVSQQFAVTVNSVWLQGPGAAERAAELQPHLQTPVRVSPEPETPTYWAEEVVRLPKEFCPNLISTEQRLAPQREALLRVTSLVSMILVIAATASFGFFQYLAARQRTNIRQLDARIRTLQAEHVELQRIHDVIRTKEIAVRTVVDDRLPPVPAYFMAYLGQVTPPEMRLTDIRVKRHGEFWKVQVSGIPQTNGPSGQPNPGFPGSVGALTKALTNAPFFLELQGGSTIPVAAPAPVTPTPSEISNGSIAAWAARRSAATTAATPARAGGALPRDRFTLEGWLK